LHEILSLGLGKGMNTKTVWAVYNKLIENFENEFNILLNINEQELIRVLDNKLLVDLILKNRQGKIKVKPGYDGVYGKALLGESSEKSSEKSSEEKIKEQNKPVEKQNNLIEKQSKLF